EGRRLPRAIGPEDAEYLAAPHGERDAVNGHERAKCLAQLIDADDVVAVGLGSRHSRSELGGSHRRPPGQYRTSVPKLRYAGAEFMAAETQLRQREGDATCQVTSPSPRASSSAGRWA